MDNKRNIWILTLIAGIICNIGQAESFSRNDYPSCTQVNQQNDGHSSLEVEGVSYWSHCGFPNPRYNWGLCGRPSETDADYRLCDPDDVLSAYLSIRIDDYLSILEEKTPYQCQTLIDETMNFTLLIAAVRHIQTPDLTVSGDVCINDCYEMQPTLDPQDRNATEEEKQVALESFAEGLLDDWASSFCDNTAVVVYWYTEQKLATAAGPRAKKYLTDTRISRVQTKALQLIQDGQIQEGFQHMIESYQMYLIGFSPAYILLCMFGFLLLVVAIFLFLAFGIGKSTMGEYWDEGHGKEVVKFIFKVICGIWLVEALIMSLIRLEEKARFWWAVIPLAGFVGCLVAALTIQAIGDGSDGNSTVTA